MAIVIANADFQQSSRNGVLQAHTFPLQRGLFRFQKTPVFAESESLAAFSLQSRLEQK